MAVHMARFWQGVAALSPLLFAALGFAAAFEDEGHMIVAAIARRQLRDVEVRQLEKHLALLEEDYPGSSTLTTAATWLRTRTLDDLSSPSDDPPTEDALLIFPSHFESRTYNPQGLPKNAPMRAGSPAEYRLSELVRRAMVALTTQEIVTEQGRSKTVVGTANTINWSLRSVLHGFGDLHQPLHVLETFTKLFPEGDDAGKKITVLLKAKGDGDENTLLTTLHSLWDTCGTLYYKRASDVDPRKLERQAEALMKEYPETFFGDRLQGELSGANSEVTPIIVETFEIGKKVLFEELDIMNLESKDQLPYVPSRKYIEKLESICKEQLVIAGYRLANALRFVLKTLAPAHEVIEHARVPALCAANDFSLANNLWTPKEWEFLNASNGDKDTFSDGKAPFGA